MRGGDHQQTSCVLPLQLRTYNCRAGRGFMQPLRVPREQPAALLTGDAV